MAGPLLNLHVANTLPTNIPELILTKSMFYLCCPGPCCTAPWGFFPLHLPVSSVFYTPVMAESSFPCLLHFGGGGGPGRGKVPPVANGPPPPRGQLFFLGRANGRRGPTGNPKSPTSVSLPSQQPLATLFPSQSQLGAGTLSEDVWAPL